MQTTVKTEQRRRARNMLLLTVGIVCAAGLLLLAVRGGLRIPCILYQVTGLRCPGCGNTRAVIALADLDLARALSHNLLFPLEFFYIGWVYAFCVTNYVKNKRFAYRTPVLALDICVLSAVLLWMVVRNVLHI